MRGGPLIRDFRELFRTEKARAAHRYVRFSCPSQPSSERIVRGLPFGEIKAAAARLAKRWKCGTVEVQVARAMRRCEAYLRNHGLNGLSDDAA